MGGRGPRAEASAELDRSRDRIHAAALRLFARHGYEGVSLQRIADAVGLHKSTLFHHYRGKLELATEVLEAALERILVRMRPLREQDPPTVEGFLAVVDALVDHFSEEPETARLCMYFLFAPEDSELDIPISRSDDHPVPEIYTLLWEWLERARKAGAVRAVNVRQAVINLIGVMLFYPASVDGGVLSGPTPFSPSARRHRKEELHLMIRGLLEPR